MAALGWLLNLDFAATESEAPAPEGYTYNPSTVTEPTLVAGGPSAAPTLGTGPPSADPTYTYNP